MKRTPLRRKAPMPKPKAPIRPVNRKRRARLREAQFSEASGYYAHVVASPCAYCGRPGPSDPAHVGRTRGAGAKADRLLPLCREDHDAEHHDRNAFNLAFEVRHGWSPAEAALARYRTYHRE